MGINTTKATQMEISFLITEKPRSLDNIAINAKQRSLDTIELSCATHPILEN